MVENDSYKHKTKEADHVKAAIGNRKTTTTKPVGITTPSPTQPCCQIEGNSLYLSRHSIKILASFDCSSTTFKIAQQNELMTTGKSLKELANRASKAVQEKTRLIEKESIKLTISRNLDCNITRYKEVKSEVTPVE
ncbi:hypothetical protein V6N13_090603 [Hibiscus sabdariffa]|uniref:Uncharacterized protein n=2 Tax=Hibiscus sabdariffa TaxID=183260 RepID=A0ABR2AL31_9ROSI